MSTKVVSLRLPEEVYCKLQEKAVKEGKQIGILVKEIVENHTKVHKSAGKSCIQLILSRLNPFKCIKMHGNTSKSIEIAKNVSKQQITANNNKLQQITPKHVVVIPYSKFVNIENTINELSKEMKDLEKTIDWIKDTGIIDYIRALYSKIENAKVVEFSH